MNKLLLCTFLLLPYFSHAQNWQCVNSGTVRYFLNDEHYLRAIKIDSVKLSGFDSVLYTFRSDRGWVPKNNFAGSWLGDRIILQQDGKNLFINAWNDTIVINTCATLNQKWTMFADSLYYTFEATVTNIDTMTIFGILDSVKTITITVKQGNSIINNHVCSGRQIKITQSNGFAQVFELYYFPYRVPGSTKYELPHDYDVLFSEANTIAYLSPFGVKDFNLVYFKQPTKAEVYNYNVGDKLQNHYEDVSANLEQFITDEVVKKNTLSNSIEYEIQRTIEEYHKVVIYYPYGRDTIIYSISNETHKLSVDSSDITPFNIPESLPLGDIENDAYYYYPHDTSYCLESPVFCAGTFRNCSWFGYCHNESFYKVGIGKICFAYIALPGPLFIKFDTLTFSNISNNPCGIPKWPVNIKTTPKPETITISPNPADDNIRINIPGNSDICQLLLTDMMGKTITQFESNKETITIPVNNIPQGIYSISIRLKEMLYHYKIAVRH